jgi:hypothetical protein
MKVSRRACDLCGVEIKKGQPYAKLTEPEWDAKAETATDESLGMSLSFVSFFGHRKADGTKEHDVCRGCVEGLFRAQQWLREQIKAELA